MLQMILRQRRMLEEQGRIIRHLTRRLASGPEAAVRSRVADGSEAQVESLHADALSKVLLLIMIIAVFRILDILVWIRIRGSMPLTNGSGFGSGSCYFRHWPSRRQQKSYLKKSFSAYYCTFEGAFTSFFKDKKSKRSQKTVGIKDFLTIFAWGQKDPDSGGPKTCWSVGSGSGTLMIRKQCDKTSIFQIQVLL